MSGICGIVHFDGEPVDPSVLGAMTAFMAFRGPDARSAWCQEGAGLGHTLLQTTFDSGREHQPSTLDRRTWITADARIDARAELKAALAAAGHEPAADATDDLLILHAWHAWGERCVEHLLGDFAFAIWDSAAKRLYCARDPFGAKPFFFMHARHRVVFSNTLGCVRRHPGVPSTLDDLSMADFLLFESFQDPAATAFAQIRRLPPGHCLAVTEGGAAIREFWKLPESDPVRFRRRGDYVERFQELLDAAVHDRLRIDRIGIELTGGMDSTSVAATAMRLLSNRGSAFQVNAQTFVYDRLIPDEERHYAGMVAEHLGIPIHYFAADQCELGERREESAYALPEPTHDLKAAKHTDGYRQASSYCRVVLTGWDGDALLNESPKPYLRSLVRQRRFARAAWSAVGYGLSQRRLIPLSWRKPAASNSAPEYPPWINGELETRLDLRRRWERVQRAAVCAHPVRPHAFRALELMRKSSFFDALDPGATRMPLEHRHPLLDVRLVGYCLSLPPLPWCVKKKILREAMRGVLPGPVLRRPKTPLAGWPEIRQLREPGARWVDEFTAAAQLARYVDRSRIPPVHPMADPEEAWSHLRPLSLNLWMSTLQTEKTR